MVKWDEMSPREKDKLIAEKVMGIVVSTERTPNGAVLNHLTGAVLPHYSTSIADAWEIVTLMRSEMYNFTLDSDEDTWICLFRRMFDKRYKAIAQTAPEAICKTALLAHGIEV